ncbi:MAG: hypothetical protein LBK46_07175 [Oscillospiraceae bacterium]|nr:hypothetical protein [Oscillospiraceae bacterium]
MRRKTEWSSVTFWFVFITLMLSIVYAVVRIVLSPSGAVDGIEHDKMKSDYALMLIQCALGVCILFLPSALERKLKVSIPQPMHIAFMIFLYCAIYLGEVRSFYYRIPFWDSILHAFSGAMLGALGFVVIQLLNDHKGVHVELSPVFVSLFAFCFGLTCGTIWEIYEFTFDWLLKLNMQKFMLESGEALVGQAALLDTMKDIIVDAAAVFAVTFGPYFVRKAKG